MPPISLPVGLKRKERDYARFGVTSFFYNEDSFLSFLLGKYSAKQIKTQTLFGQRNVILLGRGFVGLLF